LLSNKEQQELLDDAYKNYLQHYADEYNEEQKKAQKNPLYWMEMEYTNIRPYPKEDFIDKCKTDSKFSEKWGLKIEQRELRQFERVKLLHKAWKNNGITPEHEEVSTLWVEYKNLMEKYNIPTQIIIVTYQDQTIESYEN
jgi:hypothetical protein